MQRFLDLIKDEPWVFGILLGGVDEFLGQADLVATEVMTIGGRDSIARYLTKSDGTQVGATAMAEAMSRAAAQAATEGGAAPPDHPSLERMREQQRQMAYQLVEARVRG